jgi:hypothetical protein
MFRRRSCFGATYWERASCGARGGVRRGGVGLGHQPGELDRVAVDVLVAGGRGQVRRAGGDAGAFALGEEDDAGGVVLDVAGEVEAAGDAAHGHVVARTRGDDRARRGGHEQVGLGSGVQGAVAVDPPGDGHGRGGHGLADVLDRLARRLPLVRARVLPGHRVEGALGDGARCWEQRADGVGERRRGGGDGVLVDVALVVLVAEPHGHADAADLDVVVGDLRAGVVREGVAGEDADVAGRAQQVVPVQERVDAAADDRDVPVVGEGVELLAWDRGFEVDLPLAERVEGLLDGHPVTASHSR